MGIRRVIEERNYKGTISQEHTSWLIQKVLAFRNLLREWESTPYFDTYEEYQQWADEFRERVNKELEDL